MTRGQIIKKLRKKIISLYKDKGEITLSTPIEVHEDMWNHGCGNVLRKIRIIDNPYYGRKCSVGNEKYFIECYIGDDWCENYDIALSSMLKNDQLLMALSVLSNIDVVKHFNNGEYAISKDK